MIFVVEWLAAPIAVASLMFKLMLNICGSMNTWRIAFTRPSCAYSDSLFFRVSVTPLLLIETWLARVAGSPNFLIFPQFFSVLFAPGCVIFINLLAMCKLVFTILGQNIFVVR